MKSSLIKLFFITSLLISYPLQAYDSMNLLKGTIGAVGVVTNENGDPKLIEYDSTGRHIRELTEYTGLDKIRIVAAEAYKALYQVAQDLKQANPGSRLINRQQYEAQAFTTRTKDPEAVTKPRLLFPEDTRSLLIVDEAKLLIPNPAYEGLILQEFSSDLSPGNGQELGDNIVSLLINKDGGIEYQSQYDIGYKVDIFKRDDSGWYELDSRGFRIPIYPLAQVPVIAGDLDTLPFGGTGSDREGRYVLPYAILPCPGFYFEMKVPIVAKIVIKNFNPKEGSSSHNMRSALNWDYASCVGYGDLPMGMNLQAISAQMEARAIVATMSKPIHNLDLWFATMQLAVRGELNNEDNDVLLQNITEYSSDDTPIEKLGIDQYTFDFDGDSKIDTIRINPDDPTKIDVYLGDKKPENDDGSRNPPDLTRLADYKLLKQLQPQGLLKSISQTDLEDTDIYIYRASTNQLLGEIEGLNSPDNDTNDAVKTALSSSSRGLVYQGVHEDESIATFSFASLLIGSVSADFTSNFRTEGLSRRPWLPSESQAADFNNDQKPDFLRPGEMVKVVAINRATGYIGTKEIRLAESFSKGEGLRQHRISLGPPNLKVIATRTYKDQAGLTKDKQHKDQLIGSEGAGLTSDQYVKIQTVWLDKDGTPLPENMPGYTARLAISTGDATSGFSENFEVKPGFQTEFIQLNNQGDLRTEHFYVQVVGENFDGNPTFESPGAGEGKLQTRPKKYAPIKVPVYNELATYESQKALIKARQDEVEGLPDEVQPIYHWVYRPEMQFSVYDFRTQQLQLTHDEGSVHLIDLTQETKLDVLSLLLADDVDFVELLYDLLDPDNDELPGFAPDRQLILSIGAEEVLADLTPGGVVRFENSKHINLLSSEDLTTISLYQNNDSFNTLWEYNFYAIAGKVDNNRDGVVELYSANITGDENPVSGADKGDDATKELPFRFWVNNDYDVVNDSGNVKADETACPPTVGNQVCEQWDETDSDKHNTTDDNHFGRIESERDLEDFTPLLIGLPLPLNKDGYPELPDDTHFSFIAHNININLFRSVWKEGDEYLQNAETIENQVKPLFDVDNDGEDERMYMFKVGTGNPEEKLVQSDIEDYFGKSRMGNFIFESYEESPQTCVAKPEDCYLELALKKGNEVLGSHKIYMQFYDVKHFYDHYSVGTGWGGDNRLASSYFSIHEGVSEYININKDKDGGFENEYIMMVHGWRMKYPERVSFGETAFKRLYWSGYKGRFGLYSWPTGWFDLPAHEYGIVFRAAIAAFHAQNYGDSEVIARAAGGLLANLLTDLGAENRLHIFAHSMGNVVVSEALRNANGGELVNHYVASQAAEVASAYNPYSDWMDYQSFGATAEGVEAAWRSLNVGSSTIETEYDMPPNHYGYTIQAQHGATKPALELLVSQRDNWGPSYYSNIGSAAGRIINFYNTDDAALDAWEFNQLTKPDVLAGPTWHYDWDWECPYSILECALRFFPDYELGEKVTDDFTRDGTNLTWTPGIPISEESAQILAHIIPSRSGALGQGVEGGLVIDGNVGFNYGADNQGHSAQFYSNFLSRKEYWSALLEEFGLAVPNP